jgi:ABC-2 type transport system permease protein
MGLRQLFLIALKDLRLIFRDRSALILMLLAPFALTIGMGAITGQFSSGVSSVFSDVPVLIVNHDEGSFGSLLVDTFSSPELADLLAPELLADETAARARVDADEAAALIIIPSGFSASFTTAGAAGNAPIIFYENPTRSNGASLLRSVLDQFISRLETGRIASEVITSQMVASGRLSPQEAPAFAGQAWQLPQAQSAGAITVKTNLSADEALAFNVLAYIAPGMVAMFLMYTVTYGAHSLLSEQRNGTLQRMLVAPVSSAQVLGGKFTGIFLTAVAQMAIVIGGTSLLFGLQWGDALGAVLLILAAAFGATGWGVLMATLFKTPAQISISGTVIMLLFAVLGGSFFDLTMLPDWVSVLNKITPNAWMIEGFHILALGGRLPSISSHLLGLTLMGLILFALGALLIARRGLGVK